MSDVNKTDIIIVLDRSGSMRTCKGAMEDALNEFLNGQKELGGKCKVTLAQFDDEYELVFERVKLADVPAIVIDPRRMTALLDAIGKTINGVKVPKKRLVVFVIVTDGLENFSKEFTSEQIVNKIKDKEDQGWQFVFLGANQDAVKEGIKFGLKASQSMTYAPTDWGTKSMSSSLCRTVSTYRKTGDEKSLGFTDEERKEAMEE